MSVCWRGDPRERRKRKVHTNCGKSRCQLEASPDTRFESGGGRYVSCSTLRLLVDASCFPLPLPFLYLRVCWTHRAQAPRLSSPSPFALHYGIERSNSICPECVIFPAAFATYCESPTVLMSGVERRRHDHRLRCYEGGRAGEPCHSRGLGCPECLAFTCRAAPLDLYHPAFEAYPEACDIHKHVYYLDDCRVLIVIIVSICNFISKRFFSAICTRADCMLGFKRDPSHLDRCVSFRHLCCMRNLECESGYLLCTEPFNSSPRRTSLSAFALVFQVEHDRLRYLAVL